jgi:hypothetical protein
VDGREIKRTKTLKIAIYPEDVDSRLPRSIGKYLPDVWFEALIEKSTFV